MSNSLWPHGLQHARLLCPSLSLNLLRFVSIEFLMPSNHIILHCPLLLLPSIFPSIRVFSNGLALCNRWLKYWSFSFSPPNIQGWHPLGLTGLRILIIYILKNLSSLFRLLYFSSLVDVYSCHLEEKSLWFLRKLSTFSSCIVHLDILFCEVQVWIFVCISLRLSVILLLISRSSVNIRDIFLFVYIYSRSFNLWLVLLCMIVYVLIRLFQKHSLKGYMFTAPLFTIGKKILC